MPKLKNNTGADSPQQFSSFRFGRDYFLGAMLYLNDEDLSSLTIGGSAIAGLAK